MDTSGLSPEVNKNKRISRRWLLKAGAAATISATAPTIPFFPFNSREAHAASSEKETVTSHQQFISKVAEISEKYGLNEFLTRFTSRMKKVANSLVDRSDQSNPLWLIPSPLYPQHFSRDGFWLAAALDEKAVTDASVKRFGEDQKRWTDGHIATALYKDNSVPPFRDRDEESTMMYVLLNLLLKRSGGEVDKQSLERAYKFILDHVNKNGEYITNGEARDVETTNAYHCWLDSFKNPPGSVIAYNQGLYYVTLRALREMGIKIEDGSAEKSQNAYDAMTNPSDNLSLPQRKSSTAIDVSALVGEALSLYFFDEPLLSNQRIAATIKILTKNAAVWDSNDPSLFLGFKVLSRADGSYFSSQSFVQDHLNEPGTYQNGGSWFLYDVLALYAGARHGIQGCITKFFQRMEWEDSRNPDSFSHEYIRTDRDNLGHIEPNRANYGWNTFVTKLLP